VNKAFGGAVETIFTLALQRRVPVARFPGAIAHLP
jgi:hypothetical protein